MVTLVVGTSCRRALGFGIGLAVAVFMSEPASAGCALDEAVCRNHCQMGPSLFGGIGGGTMGGLELGSCENSCANTYRACLKLHPPSAEDIQRARKADKEFEEELQRRVKLAALQEQKRVSDRETSERDELRLLLAWHAQNPDPANPSPAQFATGSEAVVTRSVPLRSYYPDVRYGDGAAYADDALDSSRAKLNDRLYPITGSMPVGTRVEILYIATNGTVSVKQLDGEHPGRTGYVVIGALGAAPSDSPR